MHVLIFIKIRRLQASATAICRVSNSNDDNEKSVFFRVCYVLMAGVTGMCNVHSIVHNVVCTVRFGLSCYTSSGNLFAAIYVQFVVNHFSWKAVESNSH